MVIRLCGGLNVSRETVDRLEVFADLVKKWNRTINLVSKSTINEIWSRHIIDSAQLFIHKSPSANNWLDMGSGGGFPGVVLSILSAELAKDMQITLIESDQRKATFLRTAVRELSLQAEVKTVRIEDLPLIKVDVVSARAFAPLEQLLVPTEKLITSNGVAIFPKGKTWDDEIEKARRSWNFDIVAEPSITDNEARILKLWNITRASR